VTLEVVTFWALAILLIGSALSVVLTKNLFHSVLYLALSLVATAGVFLALDAEFLAAVQLLLYAGGVITIVVFAIVVTERLVGDRITQTSRHIVTGAVLAGALLLGVLRFLRGAELPVDRPVIAVDVTRAIGQVLLTEFALPFELLAVLLLVGLLGALYFARPEE
jgi:NADH-quinone oxidoreductase subunit J